jgi:beta-lactamase class A
MKKDIRAEKKIVWWKNKKTIYVFLFFLLGLNILLFFLFAQEKRSENYVNPYPFIDPSRSFIEQENFFTTIEPLRRQIISLLESYESEGFEIGFYFEYLNTGASISFNDDKRFFPASLSKMPTAFVVAKKIQEGDWKLSNELVLFMEDRNSDFGELYKEPVGTRLSIEMLLKELLINSDDTAHRMFIRNLDGEEYEQLFFALGLEDLYDTDYRITAREYTRIFRSLYTSSYLNREHSTLLLTILADTPFTTFLDAGLPESVPFAHKIGINEFDTIYLDSGIVYIPNRPYLITMMIDVPPEKTKQDAERMMQEISETIYLYVSNY